MKIGITIPNNFGISDPVHLSDLAVMAEELGFASIFTMEHVIHTDFLIQRLGTRPYYHPLATLSFIAGRTSRIALGTSVLVMPFHHPLELAKYLASLDHFSRGRVILGAGVGAAEEEFVATNIPWAERGTRTDETIEIMKLLWSEDTANFQGRHWQFSNLCVYPKPYQRSGIPIWIGGQTRAAKRRAARLAQGWQPTGIPAEEFGEGVKEIRDVLAAEGRDATRFEFCMRMNLQIEDEFNNELEQRALISWDAAAQIERTARAFESAGATHFMFALNSRSTSALEKATRAIARVLL